MVAGLCGSGDVNVVVGVVVVVVGSWLAVTKSSRFFKCPDIAKKIVAEFL